MAVVVAAVGVEDVADVEDSAVAAVDPEAGEAEVAVEAGGEVEEEEEGTEVVLEIDLIKFFYLNKAVCSTVFQKENGVE